MQKNQKTTIAIFSYGGGMRGLIPAHFMARIEDVTGLRMAEMADIFAGPSSGAIINGAMTMRHPDHPGRPRYRARHIVKFYENEGIKIFPRDGFREFRGIVHDFNNRTLKLNQLNSLIRHGHYDPANLGRALKNMYGDAKLSDSLASLIIPTYSIDGSSNLRLVKERDESGESPVRTKNNFADDGGHAMWLKNIKTGTPHDVSAQTPDVSLYDAVMASAAAPSFFPCHHFPVRFPHEQEATYRSAIDGVIFDNPCISYLGAIRQHVPKDHRLIMIVLGTGYTNRSVKREDWNRYGALGIVDPVNDLPLINMFFHASETALMESFAAEMGANLFVFNKSMIPSRGEPGAANTDIDDASPENLKALERFFETILEENKSQFEDVCHILSSHRDRKNEDDRQKSKQNGLKHFISLIRRK